MSTSITKPETVTAESGRLKAYVELTKLRISVMVLFTFGVAAILEGQLVGPGIGLGALTAALVGMLAIAGSGNAMNMYLERYSDFFMPRTAGRPLPAQRLSATEVVTFGAVSFGVGVAFLFTLVNWQTAVCGMANWILYVFVYTPMKRHSHLNTEVGAVAGALPIVMGALAASGGIGLVCWSFFGVLFFWQFPHFMAIAWKYRHQYKAGGLKMLTVTEPTGLAAGRKAVVTAIMLIVVSLVPIAVMDSYLRIGIFVVGAIALGVYYLRPSIEFCKNRNDQTARKLLRSSLLYLPLYMMLMLVLLLV